MKSTVEVLDIIKMLEGMIKNTVHDDHGDALTNSEAWAALDYNKTIRSVIDNISKEFLKGVLTTYLKSS